MKNLNSNNKLSHENEYVMAIRLFDIISLMSGQIIDATKISYDDYIKFDEDDVEMLESNAPSINIKKIHSSFPHIFRSIDDKVLEKEIPIPISSVVKIPKINQNNNGSNGSNGSDFNNVNNNNGSNHKNGNNNAVSKLDNNYNSQINDNTFGSNPKKTNFSLEFESPQISNGTLKNDKSNQQTELPYTTNNSTKDYYGNIKKSLQDTKLKLNKFRKDSTSNLLVHDKNPQNHTTLEKNNPQLNIEKRSSSVKDLNINKNYDFANNAENKGNNNNENILSSQFSHNYVENYIEKETVNIDKKDNVNNGNDKKIDNAEQNTETFNMSRVLNRVNRKILGFNPDHIPQDLETNISVSSLEKYVNKSGLQVPLKVLVNGCHPNFQVAFSRADMDYEVDIDSSLVKHYEQILKNNKSKIDESTSKTVNKDSKNVNRKSNELIEKSEMLGNSYDNNFNKNTSTNKNTIFGIDIIGNVDQKQIVIKALFNKSENLSIDEILSLLVNENNLESLTLLSDKGGLMAYDYNDKNDKNSTFAKDKAQKIYRNILMLGFDLEIDYPEVFSFQVSYGMISIFITKNIGFVLLQKEDRFQPGQKEKILICLKEITKMLD